VSKVTRRSYPSTSATTLPPGGYWDDPAAQWNVPSVVGWWTSLIANSCNVSSYVDRHAQTPLEVVVERSADGLTFDSGSVVYVARRDLAWNTTSRYVYYVLSRILSTLQTCRYKVSSPLWSESPLEEKEQRKKEEDEAVEVGRFSKILKKILRSLLR